MSLMKGFERESCAPFWCPILVYGWQGGLAISTSARSRSFTSMSTMSRGLTCVPVMCSRYFMSWGLSSTTLQGVIGQLLRRETVPGASMPVKGTAIRKGNHSDATGSGMADAAWRLPLGMADAAWPGQGREGQGQLLGSTEAQKL